MGFRRSIASLTPTTQSIADRNSTVFCEQSLRTVISQCGVPCLGVWQVRRHLLLSRGARLSARLSLQNRGNPAKILPSLAVQERPAFERKLLNGKVMGVGRLPSCR